MAITRLTQRLWPTTLLSKLTALAILVGAGPLLLVCLLFMSAPSLTATQISAIGLGFFVLTTLIFVAAVRGLLAPLRKARRTLREQAFFDAGAAKPDGATDEAAHIAHMVDRLLHGMRLEIKISQTAADTDPLTGLLNRRGFDRCQERFSAAGVIYLDIDHFKSINDQLGHAAGDRLLQATADLLRSGLRDDEVVARFGGDEFVILLPSANLHEAQIVAERLRSMAEAKLSSALGPMTLSAGVAIADTGTSIIDALMHADRAAYAAKHAGRNQVQLAANHGTFSTVRTAAE